ncbi:MAG: Gfo/Idh/MocA family oxidoreductase [Pirellulales bacterium]|nr:Gfo/Idh/MocA family oxidoreductase [Pirellulales bacterium]
MTRTHRHSVSVRLAIIGAGKVAAEHHVPGIAHDPRCELVAICDTNEQLVNRRQAQWQVSLATSRPERIISDPDIDGVIIATPNASHAPLALAAIAAGKHVMCEKPLGLSVAEAATMFKAARAAGIVHMTAFTYRFAPAMRYLRMLVQSGDLGEPRHFRSQRFLDWPETSWGWRQSKALAGAGDLYDMTIHRIDFGLDLLGPIDRICGALERFCLRGQTEDGAACESSDVDDWSCLLGRFVNGATGVWEGTTLAKGYHMGGVGHDWAEVNGSTGTAIYRLGKAHSLLLGKPGKGLEDVAVPENLLTPAGSPRDPQGQPAAVGFRQDLIWEFVSAIREGRDAAPSFADGWQAQVIADAAIQSDLSGSWVEIPRQKP